MIFYSTVKEEENKQKIEKKKKKKVGKKANDGYQEGLPTLLASPYLFIHYLCFRARSVSSVGPVDFFSLIINFPKNMWYQVINPLLLKKKKKKKKKKKEGQRLYIA